MSDEAGYIELPPIDRGKRDTSDRCRLAAVNALNRSGVRSRLMT
jgi:hypothetical protein